MACCQVPITASCLCAQENVRINKVTDQVHCFCLDGRDFIKMINSADGWDAQRMDQIKTGSQENGQKYYIPQQWSRPDQGLVWHHAVMNLPKTAISFCDAFAGTFNKDTWQGQLPLVHCYSFQKSETDEGMCKQVHLATPVQDENVQQLKIAADVIKRVEQALGGPLDEAAVVHKVRLVAPDKHHVCITFRIPRAVAFNTANPAKKRPRTQLM